MFLYFQQGFVALPRGDRMSLLFSAVKSGNFSSFPSLGLNNTL